MWIRSSRFNDASSRERCGPAGARIEVVTAALLRHQPGPRRVTSFTYSICRRSSSWIAGSKDTSWYLPAASLNLAEKSNKRAWT